MVWGVARWIMAPGVYAVSTNQALSIMLDADVRSVTQVSASEYEVLDDQGLVRSCRGHVPSLDEMADTFQPWYPPTQGRITARLISGIDITCSDPVPVHKIPRSPAADSLPHSPFLPVEFTPPLG